LPDLPDRGNGRDALMRHWADYFVGWNDYESTVAELIDGGDDVVLIVHERARLRGSDVVSTATCLRFGRSAMAAASAFACSRRAPRRSKLSDSRDRRAFPVPAGQSAPLLGAGHAIAAPGDRVGASAQREAIGAKRPGHPEG
jgi:hypothetical protein